MAERAKEESRGLEREEKGGELGVGGREQLMVTAMFPPSEPGGGR